MMTPSVIIMTNTLKNTSEEGNKVFNNKTHIGELFWGCYCLLDSYRVLSYLCQLGIWGGFDMNMTAVGEEDCVFFCAIFEAFSWSYNIRLPVSEGNACDYHNMLGIS